MHEKNAYLADCVAKQRRDERDPPDAKLSQNDVSKDLEGEDMRDDEREKQDTRSEIPLKRNSLK